MKETYSPLEDRVLIKPHKSAEPETTASGIVTSMKVRQTFVGEVVAVGPGRYAVETGVFMPNVLAKGDIVVCGVNSGMPVDIPGDDGVPVEHLIMREGDVFILVSKKS